MKTFKEMERNFCRYCSHCRKLKVAIEEDEKREVEEERLTAEKHVKMEEEKCQEIQQGIVYGREFQRYQKSDIVKITNLAFLYELYENIIPHGQPPTEWEFKRLQNKIQNISARIDVLENKS